MVFFVTLMATITDLSVQKRNKHRVNVFLDGEFAFGLAASVAAGLSIGQEVSAEQLAELEQKEQLESAKQVAFGYVSLRPRSEYELRAHLRRKSYEDVIVDSAVQRLRELDLLDDKAFADYWIEQRETFRPRSHFALIQELRQKGISRDIVEAALEGIDERASAQRAAEKQALRLAGLPEDAFRMKLAGFLQRRGFPFELINDVVDEAWRAVNED